jgi:F-type H+-transporting ATPase subunit b
MDYRQHAIEVFDFQILHLQLNTPLFIFVLLLVVMLALNYLLFRPVLRTLDGRQAEYDRLAQQAEQQKNELAALTEQYKRDLDRVRGEVEAVRQDAHANSHKAQVAVLEKARADADKALQSALAELKSDVDAARKSLGRTARQLAEQTAERMLTA